MMSSAVEASGLRVVRGGREVLHSLDFRIPQGSIVGLLGPSGCGKTTLMRAIVGMQIVTDGKVTVLGHPAGQVTATLSGGQLSRASLAVALLGKPELLVLDEPTIGLDPVLRNELWKLFHGLSEDGVTLLISSHVMDEAARCQRLLLMRDGEFLFDDTPEALRSTTGLGDMEQAFVQLIE